MEEQYKRWEQGREELLHRRGAKERGLPVACQVQTPLTYKGHRLRKVYQADLIVDHSLLVEVKSVDALAAIHQSQLLTYWKLNSLPLGLLLNFNVPLLLNFNVPLMKKGIKRLVMVCSPCDTLRPLPFAVRQLMLTNQGSSSEP